MVSELASETITPAFSCFFVFCKVLGLCAMFLQDVCDPGSPERPLACSSEQCLPSVFDTALISLHKNSSG